MKKLIYGILVSAFLVFQLSAMLALPAAAAADGKSWGKVPVSGDTIKIDGVKDGVYDKALAVDISVLNADTMKNTGAKGTGYILWNGKDTIYVYATVTDAEVLEPAANADAWNIDSVEVFIDYSNTAARTRDQYRVNWKGEPTFHDGTKTYTKADVGKYGFTTWAAQKTSKGYDVEFEIKAYKETISANMKIGFDLQINDMYTANNAQTRSVFNAKSSLSSKGDAKKYDYIELSSDTVKAAAATTAAAAATVKAASSTAPQTADISVAISFAAAAISAAAGTLFRKNKR